MKGENRYTVGRQACLSSSRQQRQGEQKEQEVSGQPCHERAKVRTQQCRWQRRAAYDFCRLDNRLAPPQAALPPAMHTRAMTACSATAPVSREGAQRQGEGW